MSVSLAKNSMISLDKETNKKVNNIIVALGWDASGVIGSDFDLDAWALALTGDGVKTKDLVYYSNSYDVSGCIHHCGDSLTGEGDGDNEIIQINLAEFPADYKCVLVGATIFRADKRGQSFKNINNAFIRVYDANTDNEICRFDSGFHNELADSKTVLFGAFLKNMKTKSWNFVAVGDGSDIVSIPEILNVYGNFLSDIE